MSTADQVERYVGRTTRPVRVEVDRAGRHRAEMRAKMTVRRFFYLARHRIR
jgi:hypothetical protein